MDKKTKTFLIILLAVYSAALTWIILFKMAVRLDDVGFGTVRAWNLIPFRYSEETSFHLTEVLENVIAFVPLGVYLGMFKTGAWKAILRNTRYIGEAHGNKAFCEPIIDRDLFDEVQRKLSINVKSS